MRPPFAPVAGPAAATQPGPDAPAPARLDEESRAWLADLHATGPVRDAAVARLHAFLLRAARFEVGRRAAMVAHLRGNDRDDIALQSANDALMSVLRRLDDFRGASRFTTWAYKFALLEAAVTVRRRAWQGREVPLDEPGDWDHVGDPADGPADRAERAELLAAVQRGVRTALTPHQREVMVALTLNDVPIDVLAERLGTTRGALYKTLHDARRRLRTDLASTGLGPDAARAVGGTP